MRVKAELWLWSAVVCASYVQLKLGQAVDRLLLVAEWCQVSVILDATDTRRQLSPGRNNDAPVMSAIWCQHPETRNVTTPSATKYEILTFNTNTTAIETHKFPITLATANVQLQIV